MFGVGVGALALIIVLSAFNGINKLVEELYSSFDAEIRIEPATGKTFDDSELLRNKIVSIEEIASLNRSLEETVLLKYKASQAFATIKGVDSVFIRQSNLDSLVWAGKPELYTPGGKPMLISGFMVAEKLGLFIHNAFQPIYVYAAKNSRSKTINVENAFYIEPITPSGVFAINQDIDSKYVVAPIQFVENLIQRPGRVSAYEIELVNPKKMQQVQTQLQELLGADFKVKNRYEQNELLYKTNNTEKWATFLILSFILLIATFNIIGSLTILILDKRKDLFVLKGMGASHKLLNRIFFVEGLLISITGGGIGLILGIILVILQAQFGFIPVQGLLIDHYPVVLDFMDVLSIIGIILVIGSLAAVLPTRIVLRRIQ